MSNEPMSMEDEFQEHLKQYPDAEHGVVGPFHAYNFAKKAPLKRSVEGWGICRPEPKRAKK